MKSAALLATILATIASTAVAQEAPPEYGMPIALTAAKKVMAAAEAKAREEKWPVAIAIVDNAGLLVMFQRLENTQLGSVQVALEKAQTAALFRRPTKVFEERIAEGGVNLKLLKLPGGLPMEGGLPIIVDGKVIGGIGVSGVTSTQDGMAAQAGLDALANQNAAVSAVDGTITLDGKPLADASIAFVSANGSPIKGTTDAAGVYQGSLPPRTGEYQVRISHPTGKVPPRYNEKTSLQVTLKGDVNNTIDFDLASR